MIRMLLLGALSLTVSAQLANRNPYTGRYVMTYTYEGKSHIDVFNIDPDGAFSFRDFGPGGRITEAEDKQYALNFSHGNRCLYRFLRLADKRKLRMDLVQGIPSVCPPSSELVTTEYQPHATQTAAKTKPTGHGADVEDALTKGSR